MDTYIRNRWPTDTHSVPRYLNISHRTAPTIFKLQRRKECGMDAFLWKGRFPSSRYTFTMPNTRYNPHHGARSQSTVSKPVKNDKASKSTNAKKRKRRSRSIPSSTRLKQPRRQKKRTSYTKKRMYTSRSITLCKKRKQHKHKRNRPIHYHQIIPIKIRRPHNWSYCSPKLCRNLKWKLYMDITCRPSRHSDPCPHPKPPPKPPCPPDPEPPCDCQFTQTIFHEEKFLKLQINEETILPTQDTSVASVISYAIHNHGSVPLTAEIEISPNGIDYAKDTTMTIDPQTMKVAVPLRFLRWMRLKLFILDGESSGEADVYYQAQSLGCQEEEQ